MVSVRDFDKKRKVSGHPQYPFSGHYLQLSGENIYHYLDEGPRDGEVILMLHGNPTWSFYYRHLVKSLSKKYRCIVPDHIGCGLSSKPQDYDYTLEQHIQNLQSLVDFLELQKINLIVHDWGGAIGFGLATRFPELINRTIILNTAAFTSDYIPKRIAICKTPYIGEYFIRKFNGFAFPATFMSTEKKLCKETKNGYLLPYDNYQNRIATARFVKDIPMSSRHPSYQTLMNIEEQLPKVLGKKLILWGGKDFCFHKKFYERWLEIYPEAETKYYSKGGHYILEDEKEDVLERIEEFLQS